MIQHHLILRYLRYIFEPDTTLLNDATFLNYFILCCPFVVFWNGTARYVAIYNAKMHICVTVKNIQMHNLTLNSLCFH